MKRIFILLLAASCCALAQEAGNVTYQTAGPGGSIAFGAINNASGAPVKGAPYSATITNESVQTLADGTHITQSSNGSTARDSQGRTRQDFLHAESDRQDRVEKPNAAKWDRRSGYSRQHQSILCEHWDWCRTRYAATTAADGHAETPGS
jgi:hypothetical protein